MSINGVCPDCGLVAPVVAFLAETEHRHISALLMKLPREVQEAVFYYTGLFRPAKGKALQARKFARIITELQEMVATGHVQVGHNPARPCPPKLWARAIACMLERRDRLSLPMPNHNYLLQIAWDLADAADAAREKSYHERKIVRSDETDRQQQPQRIMTPIDEYVQGLRDTRPTDEEIDEWKRQRMS